MNQKSLWLMLLTGIGLTQPALAQPAITQVYTDFAGSLWTSSTASNNPTHPNNSHNLLGFTHNSTTYSTGANDAMLTSNAVVFTPLNFSSFSIPGNSINTTTGGSTYIGVGLNYGGGPGNVLPIPVVNDMAEYLTDGANGLNLGTGVFNIPASKITYNVSGFSLGAVGDGIPDVVFTQIGTPPASANDTIMFLDINGNLVGNYIVGNVSTIPVVAQTEWKFYTPTDPPVYTSLGSPDRDLRMVAFDLSDFGLTTLSLPTITQFVHKVSGESDQAFLSHNTASFISGPGLFAALPVTLTSFTAEKINQAAQLTWTVADAHQFSHFELERQTNTSKTFSPIASIDYQNNQTKYTYTDRTLSNSRNLYRLKLTDQDGSFSYSKVVVIDAAIPATISITPNPASHTLHITSAQTIQEATLYAMDGRQTAVPLSGLYETGTIDISALAPGMYTIHVVSENNSTVHQFNVTR